MLKLIKRAIKWFLRRLPVWFMKFMACFILLGFIWIAWDARGFYQRYQIEQGIRPSYDRLINLRKYFKKAR